MRCYPFGSGGLQKYELAVEIIEYTVDTPAFDIVLHVIFGESFDIQSGDKLAVNTRHAFEQVEF